MKRQEPFWLRDLFIFKRRSIYSSLKRAGAPNENVVQNHLNIELLNVF